MYRKDEKQTGIDGPMYLKKYYILIGLLLIAMSQAMAQPRVVRELNVAIDSSRGENHLEFLIHRAEFRMDKSPSLALVDVQHGLRTTRDAIYGSRRVKGVEVAYRRLRELEVDLLNLEGQLYLAFDNRQAARKAFRSGIDISREIGYKQGITISGTGLRNLGEAYGKDFEEYKGFRKLGRDIERQFNRLLIKDESLRSAAGQTLEDIARIHEDNENYRKAITAYIKAMKLYEADQDSFKLMEMQNHIANLYQRMGDHQAAMRYATAAVEDIEALQDSLESALQMELVVISVDSMKDKRKNKIKLYESIVSPSIKAPKAPLVESKEIKASSSQSSSFSADITKSLALNDKVKQLEARRIIDSLEAETQIAQKAGEIKELEKQNMKKEADLQQAALIMSKQKYYRNVLLFSLSFIMGVSILLYILFLTQKKSHKKLSAAYRDLDTAHRQLKAAQIQLVESEKMASLGQLTAGIAHEINNPINFIGGNISPLKRDIEDLCLILEKYEETVRKEKLEPLFNEVIEMSNDIELEVIKDEVKSLLLGIGEGASRTTEIVKGLRNFARLDEEDVKKFDLHSGLDATLVLLRNKTREIDIIRNYEELPEIEGYPGKLNQVFMNILDNAVQAVTVQAEKKGVQGRIEINTYQDTDKVYVSIQDNGPGISEEVQKRIFEPFFTTKDVGVGTGLGLSISLGIVEQHQGNIKVFSEKGQGTEMLLSFPMKLDLSDPGQEVQNSVA